MQENARIREVEKKVNENFGIQNRRQLPHEKTYEYDSALKKALNETSVVSEKQNITEATKTQSDLEDHQPRIVHGVKGVKSKPFSKKFKNQAAYNKWYEAEGPDHEIHQIDKLDESAVVEMEMDEESLTSAEMAKRDRINKALRSSKAFMDRYGKKKS